MIPTKLQQAEHEVVCYYHYPDTGTTLEDVLQPEYWSHVARNLRTGHRVEIFAADGSYWAMLIVRAAGTRDAVVQTLQHVELGPQSDIVVAPSAYEVKWRGPSKKWGVVRREDNEVIRDEFAVKEQAAKWMKNHIQSLAA